MIDRDEMIIREEEYSDYLILLIEGEINSLNNERFYQHVLSRVDIGVNCLILDMKGVQFIDSISLLKFIAIFKQIKKKDGLMVLIHLNATLQRIFSMMDLDRCFPIYDNLEDANNRIRCSQGIRRNWH